MCGIFEGLALVARQKNSPTGCSKRLSSKAAGESKPEAYPGGYVEDFDEPRTKLAGCFSILLCVAAFRTGSRFFCQLTIFGSQREELLALSAGTNFKVGGAFIVDFGR